MRGQSVAALGALGFLLSVSCPAAQDLRIPAEAVDAFHAALRNKDSARALSLLDRSLIVYESGRIDSTAESYVSSHLATDMDFAAASNWHLQARRTGGEGDEHWVLSVYRVSARQNDAAPLEQTILETAILRRSAQAFRIVHLHRSTRDRPSGARSHTHQQLPQKRP